MTHMESVGIRELRQSLSAYVRRVKRGEAFAVTERGSEVAVLSPSASRSDPVGRIVADLGATAATADLLELGEPLEPRAGEVSISDALRAEREERLP